MMWCDSSHITGLPHLMESSKKILYVSTAYFMRSLHTHACMGMCAYQCVYVLLLHWVVCQRQTGKVFIMQFVEKNLSFFHTPSWCHHQHRRCYYDRYCRFVSLSFHRRLFWYSKFFTTKFIFMQWTTCSVIPGNSKQIQLFCSNI